MKASARNLRLRSVCCLYSSLGSSVRFSTPYFAPMPQRDSFQPLGEGRSPAGSVVRTVVDEAYEAEERWRVCRY